MADLEKPLVSFLKDLDPSKFVAGAETITLHKAMTMQSGIRISDEKMKELEEPSDHLKGQGQVQAFLDNSAPITPETQIFNYQRTDTQMVMQVLEAVVPGSAKDFIKTELLDKMRIRDYQWGEDVSGLPLGPYGASMTSRDMMKWGILTINKGKWQDEQLVPEAFIDKATSKILFPNAEDSLITEDMASNAYGYYWWINDVKVGDKTYLAKSAQGGGGQYIFVIEELDLLVVITAHNRKFEHQAIKLLANRIIPAFEP
jgi:CubicO group peptidase (beta-lactamase class C family)